MSGCEGVGSSRHAPSRRGAGVIGAGGRGPGAVYSLVRTPSVPRCWPMKLLGLSSLVPTGGGPRCIGSLEAPTELG